MKKKLYIVEFSVEFADQLEVYAENKKEAERIGFKEATEMYPDADVVGDIDVFEAEGD